jgi:hypothetical protein
MKRITTSAWTVLVKATKSEKKREAITSCKKGSCVASSPSEENLARWKGCVRSLILHKWGQVDETEFSSSLMPLPFPLSGFLIWLVMFCKGTRKGGDRAFWGALLKRFRWFICYIYFHKKTRQADLFTLFSVHSLMDGRKLGFVICFSTGCLLSTRQNCCPGPVVKIF